ncbi:MAG: thiosulfate oxidation carrier protein SoxY [Methylococcales symbiont of Hymedesmia sp. n. MRB-2018]|nr:MAG: thiosulfate oxidation carrier protein SoxY [Methylococcales symbiont of Hymedesmia sp. n. MRB-2018]KAF3982816.1 MAG: thiosulfate oxidation carrier protein SoxY [Methylococcales symbiont of Hymedesmia sp. n. MRB-2018]
MTFSAYGLTVASSILHASVTHTRRIKDYFNSGTFEQTMLRLFGEAEIIESKKIKISRLPRIAENGANVPITVSSTLDSVEKISILVEDNPSPLSAEFFLSPALVAHVSVRLKMAKTSRIVIIVQAEGKLYRTSRSVKVAVGGCGA